MAKIIPLDEYRELHLLRAGYCSWYRLFDDHFSVQTRPADLTNKTLSQLAEPGTKSTNALNALIIGFLGYGIGATFEVLDNRIQGYILDIELFIVDQIRFEVMNRLGWLGSFIGNRFCLFKMVRKFEQVKSICHAHPPKLSISHPAYKAYDKLIEQDQQVFIRRMLKDALMQFKMEHQL